MAAIHQFKIEQIRKWRAMNKVTMIKSPMNPTSMRVVLQVMRIGRRRGLTPIRRRVNTAKFHLMILSLTMKDDLTCNQCTETSTSLMRNI
jgi:hypothetical protein